MKIKRYDLMEDCTMEEQGRGEYVEYDAHVAAIEILRAALEGLYRAGQKQGWHNGGYDVEMSLAEAALTQGES